jgi:Cupin-like domain
MYHRKAPVATATISSSNSNGATTLSSSTSSSIKSLRRRKQSSIMNIGRKDFIIAIVSTFVLTVLIVLFMMKLYLSALQYTSSSSTKLHQHQLHHPQQRDLGKEENGNGDDDSSLPYNEMYRVPNSMKIVGDRSDRYVQLRMEIDALLPVQQYDRSLNFVKQLIQSNPYQHHTGIVQPAIQEDIHSNVISIDEGLKEPKVIQQQQQHNSDQVMNPTYDIYNCPDVPPEGYPFAWNMIQILKNWSPDNTKPPSSNIIYQSLCVFDYTIDYEKAITYRNAELPFVVMNDPAVAETVERWNAPGYVQRLMGTALHRTEYSENNHFMYYVPPPKNKRIRRGMKDNNKNGKSNNIVPAGWKAPTQLLRMSYMEWLHHANITDDTLLGPDHPHWYYRLIGCGGTGNDGSCDTESSEYLFDELTFFQPRQDQLYIVEPEEQKGIHCRFGMKGVIAENHFDGSRNAIVLLGGSRRYILAHPNQCEQLALYPKGHPSARHSAVDWSNPDLDTYPQFGHALGNELVLTAGQVLYLPTEWFHYIISLELNYQCNTRSGITKHYRQYIKQCGF